MKTNKANSLIEMYLNKADKIAEEQVETIARRILKDNPQLDEFIMGMGVWFFTTKKGENLSWDNKRGYIEPMIHFLNKWNENLHLTGIPMRFTAEGPKVTDW